MSSCSASQVVLEQLQHPVERGQRRAQLVRGGRHERAAGRLLAAQPRLHARERARQLADLVAGCDPPAAARSTGPRRSSSRVGFAQPLQAAQQRGGEADPEQQRDAAARRRPPR